MFYSVANEVLMNEINLDPVNEQHQEENGKSKIIKIMI
jgi:hypothetical protein